MVSGLLPLLPQQARVRSGRESGLRLPSKRGRNGEGRTSLAFASPTVKTTFFREERSSLTLASITTTRACQPPFNLPAQSTRSFFPTPYPALSQGDPKLALRTDAFHKHNPCSITNHLTCPRNLTRFCFTAARALPRRPQAGLANRGVLGGAPRGPGARLRALGPEQRGGLALLQGRCHRAFAHACVARGTSGKLSTR